MSSSDWTTGTAPWAYEDCVACEGSGWASKAGVPCRICSTKAMRSGGDKPSPMLYELQTSKGGVSQFRLKKEGAVNGSTPEKKEEKPKAKKKKEESKFAKPISSDKIERKPEDKPKEKEEETPQPTAMGMILCVDCIPLKFGVEVKSLSEVLLHGPVGEKIAKDLEAASYVLSNPFQRRDLVRHYAPKIAKALDGKILVIDTGNTDERECLGAFLPLASAIFKG